MWWGGGRALSRWSSAHHPLVCAAFLSSAGCMLGCRLPGGSSAISGFWGLSGRRLGSRRPPPTQDLALSPYGSDGSPHLCVPEAQGDRLDLPNLPRSSEPAAVQEGVFGEGLSNDQGWAGILGSSPRGGVLWSVPGGGIRGSSPGVQYWGRVLRVEYGGQVLGWRTGGQVLASVLRWSTGVESWGRVLGLGTGGGVLGLSTGVEYWGSTGVESWDQVLGFGYWGGVLGSGTGGGVLRLSIEVEYWGSGTGVGSWGRALGSGPRSA